MRNTHDIMIAIIVVTLFCIYGLYSVLLSPLEQEPSLSQNITGCGAGMVLDDMQGHKICFNGCYYEGRQYGCFRNLGKLK